MEVKYIMRLIINQKYFALRDRFMITHENGQPAYAVEGKLFSIGKKFYVEEPCGREIFFVKQRLFRFLPKWDIIQNGDTVAVYKGKLSFLTKRAKIVSKSFGDITIKGSVLGWTFRFFDQSGNQIAEVSKKILKIRDTYALDIFDTRYADIIMTAVIIIDALYHRGR
jgi:uncharacterized protein YxjI